jgi:hypothetical protein
MTHAHAVAQFVGVVLLNSFIIADSIILVTVETAGPPQRTFYSAQAHSKKPGSAQIRFELIGDVNGCAPPADNTLVHSPVRVVARWNIMMLFAEHLPRRVKKLAFRNPIT